MSNQEIRATIFPGNRFNAAIAQRLVVSLSQDQALQMVILLRKFVEASAQEDAFIKEVVISYSWEGLQPYWRDNTWYQRTLRAIELAQNCQASKDLLSELGGTARLGDPGVAPALIDNSEDALVLVDKWLRSDLSPFTLYASTAKVHIDNLEAWIETLGPDFEDLQDMISSTRKEIRGWELSNQNDKLSKMRSLVDELGAVYLELQTPVQDLREQALKPGSPTHVMLSYIDQIYNQKKITAAEAKRLKGILGDYTIEAVAKVKLRSELRNF